MKELTLAVRHDDKLAFAEFDADGNIMHWRVKTHAKFIEDKLDRDLPFTWVLIVGKEEREESIVCEIFDTFPVEEYGDIKNIINVPNFASQANQILSLYMEDNKCLTEGETIH